MPPAAIAAQNVEDTVEFPPRPPATPMGGAASSGLNKALVKAALSFAMGKIDEA